MDNAVVETTLGKLRGTEHNGIYAFKGIPYGAPTSETMRFMPPGKPAPWKGVRDASRFGHQSPQNMRFTYSGAKSPMPLLSEADRKVSEAMMSIWTQFARTGNPSVEGLIEWPPWDKAIDQYLYITSHYRLNPDIRI